MNHRHRFCGDSGESVANSAASGADSAAAVANSADLVAISAGPVAGGCYNLVSIRGLQNSGAENERIEEQGER
ncbi:MAG: hypothetical protein HC898_06475 [Phycisphaerales bacterium]|nr:hypothetical protein [Phycisphaerales bacterium]